VLQFEKNIRNAKKQQNEHKTQHQKKSPLKKNKKHTIALIS
jgi:hypothetical protein